MKLLLTALVVPLGLALAACSSGTATNQAASPTTSETASASAPAPPSATASAAGNVKKNVLWFDCRASATPTTVAEVQTLDDALAFQAAHPNMYCLANEPDPAPVSAIERKALNEYGTEAIDDSIDLTAAYNLCLIGGMKGIDEAWEMRAALVLCPNAPEAAHMRKLVGSAKPPPFTFEDGTYKIGKDLPPGTYRTTDNPVANCYWALVDSSANVIDNNFVTGAPQVKVTIPSSAYGFTSEGCGEWKKTS